MIVEMPLISVIIPTFNRASFVTEAVESVLSQTFEDLEILVVDDGSTDETEKCLEPYSRLLRYLKIPHRGVSASRNLGIREARGEWVAFLDSDDVWLPNKLKRQLQFIRDSPECQVCYTDEIWIRRGIRVNPRLKHCKHKGWIFEHCLPLCIISPSSALIRRRLLEDIGGFDESLPACEDYDLWLRITLRHPVIFIEEKLIIKRGGHPDQLSRKHWGLDRFRVRALWKILQEADLDGSQREAVLAELKRKCEILIRGSRKRGKEQAASFYECLMNLGDLGGYDGWESVLRPFE